MAEPTTASAPARTGTGWAVVAMVCFWPLAIGAVLASVRASRALGAGDVAAAATQTRRVRTAGIVAVVVGLLARAVSVVVLVAAVGLVDDVRPLLTALAGPPSSSTSSSASSSSTSSADPLTLPPAKGAAPAGLTGDVTFADAKPWRMLAPGDCFAQAELHGIVPLVPCGDDTASTVFYAGPSGPAWPGDEVGGQIASEVCDGALEDLGRSPLEVPYARWFTAKDGWDFWPHLVCAAAPAAGDPAPAPPPTDTRAPADGGPRHLSIALSPACFDATRLTRWGDLVVPLVEFCDEPHTGQVFAEHRIGVEVAENDATIWAAGRASCAEAWAEFVGGEYAGPPLEVWTVVPEFSEWGDGWRSVTCAVTSEEPLTASLAGSAG
ncbi:CD225/dispanin family protein [Isoptericola sp. NPDC019571]|uniref:CD225/dispanin family protein n=1 Tax=Isoptericola sp. NPDC019571 TaxID=3364008 RepID=UPI0037B29E96